MDRPVFTGSGRFDGPPEFKLSPCPFCGGHAAMANGPEGEGSVICVECRCATGVYGATAEAATAWNRRVLPAPEMREMLLKLEWAGKIEPLHDEAPVIDCCPACGHRRGEKAHVRCEFGALLERIR